MVYCVNYVQKLMYTLLLNSFLVLRSSNLYHMQGTHKKLFFLSRHNELIAYIRRMCGMLTIDADRNIVYYSFLLIFHPRCILIR